MTAEVLNLLGGGLLGAGVKLVSVWMENQRAQVELLAKRQELEQRAVEAADASADRAAGRDGGAWTRRVIVGCVMFTVFLAPVIVATCFASVPVFYAYSEGSGWWIFRSAWEQLKFVRLDGFVILPVHTQLASAIAGFYFGAGVVKGGAR